MEEPSRDYSGVRLTIYVTEEMNREMHALASRHERSFAGEVRYALGLYLRQINRGVSSPSVSSPASPR